MIAISYVGGGYFCVHQLSSFTFTLFVIFLIYDFKTQKSGVMALADYLLEGLVPKPMSLE